MCSLAFNLNAGWKNGFKIKSAQHKTSKMRKPKRLVGYSFAYMVHTFMCRCIYLCVVPYEYVLNGRMSKRGH